MVPEGEIFRDFTMKLRRYFGSWVLCILAAFSVSACSKPEPVYEAILEQSPNYSLEYGYWLETGEKFIAGFSNGFAIISSGLELEEVHTYEEQGRVRATADLSTVYIFHKDKVTKVNLSNQSVESLAGFSSDDFYDQPVWGRSVFAVPHLPSYSSRIYIPKANPFTERRGLWDVESGTFVLEQNIKWDEYFRLGIDDVPLFRVVQSHDENLPFVSIEYRDADANSEVTKVGLGEHLQANTISAWISSTKPRGFIYIDGENLGPSVFTIHQHRSRLAMQRRSLISVEGTYGVVPSLDGAQFKGRIKESYPFDVVDADAPVISLLSKALERLPANKVSLYGIKIDNERQLVVGQYTLPDYSKWLFRYESGRFRQTQLALPDEFIGGFEIRNVQFEESNLEFLIYKPSSAPTKGAIIYVHGGPHFAIGRSNLKEVKPWLERGFEVWMLPYYGTVGYGAEFASKIYSGGVEKTGAQLVQAISLANETYADGQVGVVGNSFAGLVTGFALEQEPNEIDFIWLDMPLLSVCATKNYMYFDRNGEPRDIRMFPDGNWDRSPQIYEGLNGVCDAASKFKVRDGKVEPVIQIYKDAIRQIPIRIRHGRLDRRTSPEISKDIGRTAGRHKCSGFRSAGRVAHDFGDFDNRARAIGRFMDCVEGAN